MVTIVQPAGFSLGVFASSVALAVFSPQAVLADGYQRRASALIPVPVAEQGPRARIVRG
jgi:hypothetical protein